MKAESSCKTRIIKVKETSLEEIASIAADYLKKGKLIIYPTETCYGLGADALNKEAVKKVHDTKRQSYEKPISVIVPDVEVAAKFGELDEKTKRLVKKFMPGPLTLIVKKIKEIPDLLSKETIAFRISSNEIANMIAKEFDSGITATSANLHGEKEIYDSCEVIEKFNGKVDLIIDAGTLEENKPSTIYDAVNKKIIREGRIKEEEIEKVTE